MNPAQVYLCPRRTAVLALDAPQALLVVYDEVVRCGLGQGDRYVEPPPGEPGNCPCRGQVALALSASLSQAPVAFTIECDNEFERQMPHRTSNYGSTADRGAGPWLVSMAMWWTCMRFAGEDGITAAEPTRRGWRASLRRPATLPHYPMVLHRGGFPDGS